MKSDEVDEILTENNDILLSMVPRGKITTSSYQRIFKDNYPWYQVTIRLSENVTDSKKRARDNGWGFDLDLLYLCTLWLDQRGRCAITGIHLDCDTGTVKDKNPFRASVDRIDNSKGYVRGNVRLLSHWANNAKSTWNDETFKMFIKGAFSKIS